jgi:hypothetical protein
MPTDTAAFDVTVRTAAPVPVITSGEEASHDPMAWKYHHVGNYLLNSVLPPNHGQI